MGLGEWMMLRAALVVLALIALVFGEASELSLVWSIPTAVVGIVSTLLIGKGISSKWLNWHLKNTSNLLPTVAGRSQARAV
jgi:hypothetical protein